MDKIQWHTEKRKLKELVKLKQNPRFISDENFDKLGDDLDSVGNFKALIVDSDLVILGGNQKYRKLLEKYGEDHEVEISIPSRELTEEERKKVILLDNNHRGEDDLDMLANEFANELEDLNYPDIIRAINSGNTMDSEINTDDFEERGTLVFRMSKTDYMRALSLLANAVEKTESESNEECLLKLLEEYE